MAGRVAILVEWLAAHQVAPLDRTPLLSEVQALLEARRPEFVVEHREHGIAELSDEELAAAKGKTRRLLMLAKLTSITDCFELEKILESRHG
jgi:hypothetical protein